VPVKRRVPKHRRETQPEWAQRLLVGEMPDRDSDCWHGFLGWLYFGESVSGLPDPMSREGRALWSGKLQCR
jgi:hypothetical protein